jgi:hypothetical protein
MRQELRGQRGEGAYFMENTVHVGGGPDTIAVTPRRMHNGYSSRSVCEYVCYHASCCIPGLYGENKVPLVLSVKLADVSSRYSSRPFTLRMTGVSSQNVGKVCTKPTKIFTISVQLLQPKTMSFHM